jgi:hypothetical protein
MLVSSMEKYSLVRIAYALDAANMDEANVADVN